MNNLNELTIIIPTYNRQNYVIRNINFWSNKEPQVIILDGSLNPIQEDVIINFGENINYIHLPLSFSERLGFVSDLITTKYSVLLGDDDLFLTSGLSKCIEILSKNENINCCLGRSLSFSYIKSDVYYDICYSEMRNYSIIDESPYDRVINHMSNYTCSTLYAVNRSHYFKKILKNLSKENFEDANLVELFIEMSNAYLGKSIIIPDIMWFRSIENDTLYDKSISTYQNIWLNSKKKEKLISTLNLIFNEYNPNFETNKMVAIGLENYFSLEKNNSFTKRRYIFNPSLIIKLVAFYKFKVKNLYKLKTLKETFDFTILKQKKLDHVLYTLKNDIVKYNFTEIKELEQFIHKFYLFTYGRI